MCQTVQENNNSSLPSTGITCEIRNKFLRDNKIINIDTLHNNERKNIRGFNLALTQKFDKEKFGERPSGLTTMDPP
jgi:hypothetical protein